jgi:hypothetical protein
MSSKSSTRSTKKRSSLQDSNRVKTLHQLLWLSGALQASGLLSHEKQGAVAWTKRPNHSKLYSDRAKSSRIGQIASMKKFGDPDGVGSFLYGRVEKKRKNAWKPEESKEIDLRRLPPAPPTQLPTVNELKALEEQLQNQLNKQTRRNQRMSVSRRANQSLRSVKRSLHNSTRNAKSRSMYRQSHH